MRRPEALRVTGAWLLALFSASSLSATQCPLDAQCGPLAPEFKVAMYASIVAFPMACAKLDPANAPRYEAALSAELGKLGADDQAAMDDASRDSALPAMLVAASKALEAEQSPARLLRKCSRALQRTEAAEPASLK